MSGLRSVEEHVAALLFGLAPLPAVSRATPHALGLVLAEAAVARLDLPGFDNSAMDGYAVRAAECAAAAGADASESGASVCPSVPTSQRVTRVATSSRPDRPLGS